MTGSDDAAIAAVEANDNHAGAHATSEGAPAAPVAHATSEGAPATPVAQGAAATSTAGGPAALPMAALPAATPTTPTTPGPSAAVATVGTPPAGNAARGIQNCRRSDNRDWSSRRDHKKCRKHNVRNCGRNPVNAPYANNDPALM